MNDKVYVDQLVNCIKSDKWTHAIACHLFVDVGNLDILHDFAQRLGLKRSWFQCKSGGMPHYDITHNIRDLAIKLGAVELDNIQMVEILRKWRKE